MNPIALVFGLLMLAAAAMFVLQPLRARAHATSPREATIPDAHEAHAAALNALRDLDFDYRTGKVGEDDYRGLRTQLMADTAKYIAVESEEDDRIESLVRAHKVTTGKQQCPKCHKALSGDARFCPNCGADLRAECPSCGKAVQAGDLFCRSCGNKLNLTLEMTA